MSVSYIDCPHDRHLNIFPRGACCAGAVSRGFGAACTGGGTNSFITGAVPVITGGSSIFSGTGGSTGLGLGGSGGCSAGFSAAFGTGVVGTGFVGAGVSGTGAELAKIGSNSTRSGSGLATGSGSGSDGLTGEGGAGDFENSGSNSGSAGFGASAFGISEGVSSMELFRNLYGSRLIFSLGFSSIE